MPSALLSHRRLQADQSVPTTGDDSGCSQGPRRAQRTASSMPWSLHGLSLSRHSASWSGRSEGTGEALSGPKVASGAAVSPGPGLEAGRFCSQFCLCDLNKPLDLTWAGARLGTSGTAALGVLLSPVLSSSSSSSGCILLLYHVLLRSIAVIEPAQKCHKC